MNLSIENTTSIPITLPWENIVAGTICACVSTTGLLVNILVTTSLLSAKRIKNPFTILCASLSVADGAVLAIFVFWSTPMTLTLSPLSCSFLGKKIGQLSLLFWFSSMYCTLFLSASRLFAIAHPTSYRTRFSKRNTCLTVATGWLLATVHAILYFFDGCDFYYDNVVTTWRYADTTCGQIAKYVFDLGYGVAFFIFVFILNVLSTWKIRRSNIIFSAKPTTTMPAPKSEKPCHAESSFSTMGESSCVTVAYANSQRTNNCNSSSSQSSTTSTMQRHRAEGRMFRLSVIHAGIFELMMISCHLFSRLAKGNKLGEFFATTFAWQASHTANAFLILYYSRDARLMWYRLIDVCCRMRRKRNHPGVERNHSTIDGQSSRF